MHEVLADSCSVNHLARRMLKCFYIISGLLLLHACGGGSGGSGATDQASAKATLSGQFGFQAINGQQLTNTTEVFNITDLENPVCADTTADEEIEIPESCIDSESIYWLRAVNQTFNKSLCGIVSGATILNGGFRLNAATDVVCQSLENYLRSNHLHNAQSQDILEAHIQRVINHLLAEDIDGEEGYTLEDLNQWQSGAIGLLNIDNYVSNKQHFAQLRSVPSSDIALDTHLLGHIDTRYPAQRVVYQNGIAFVANDFSVSIIDVTIPEAPRYLASWPSGWIKDIDVFNHSLYIALGDRGVEKVDISDIAQPKLDKYFPELPASKITAGKERVYFHAIDAGELVVAAINSDNSIDISRIDDDYARQMTTLLKIMNDRIYSVSTTVTTTYITIFDASSLQKIGKYSLTQDYDQKELSVLTELFIHNRVNNKTDIVEVEDTQILYLIVDPLIEKNTLAGPVKPKIIVEVDLDNYALLAQSEANFFSLIEKHEVQVGRADGIMKIHHDFDFDNKDSLLVPMPEHVKMFYFDASVAAELQENPLAAINTINSAPFQKRFQITADEKYSFFASDKYGFNILKNF